MPASRGSLVMRGGKTGVVWAVEHDHFIVLPISPCQPITRHDVEIMLPGYRDACVRAAVKMAVPRTRQELVGEVSPKTLALISAAVARAEADIRDAEKWGAEARHRRRALSEVSSV